MAADLAETLKDSPKQKDAKEGVRYTDLLVQADKARSDQFIDREIASLQEAEGLRSVGFVRERLACLKQTQKRNKDYKDASMALNDGQFDKTIEIAQQWPAIPEFDKISKDAADHRLAMARITGPVSEGRFKEVPNANQLPQTAAFARELEKAKFAERSYEQALSKFQTEGQPAALVDFLATQPYKEKSPYKERLKEAEAYGRALASYQQTDYPSALAICRQ
jgi:hypothetical protein